MYQCCRKTQKTSSKKHSRNSDKNNLSNYKFASSKFFHLHWRLKVNEKHFSTLWINHTFSRKKQLYNHQCLFSSSVYLKATPPKQLDICIQKQLNMPGFWIRTFLLPAPSSGLWELPPSPHTLNAGRQILQKLSCLIWLEMAIKGVLL